MKKVYYLLISLVGCVIGILFFVYVHEWIIIIPSSIQQIACVACKQAHKKTMIFSFWAYGRWQHESQEIIVDPVVETTLHHIIQRWLTRVEQEGELHKKVTVQSVALTNTGSIAYVSFDRNPFDKQASVYQKLVFVEGILATLRQSGISLGAVHLLVQHQPLPDYHLDFSHPWPLAGFTPVG